MYFLVSINPVKDLQKAGVDQWRNLPLVFRSKLPPSARGNFNNKTVNKNELKCLFKKTIYDLNYKRSWKSFLKNPKPLQKTVS